MQKQVYVVALEEMAHGRTSRVPGEVFELGIVDAIVLGRKKQIRRLSKDAVAAHLSSLKPKRRGTYERRDLVAKPS